MSVYVGNGGGGPVPPVSDQHNAVASLAYSTVCTLTWGGAELVRP